MAKKDVLFTYDEFPIPFSEATVKRMIEGIIKELSVKTGLPGDKVPIVYCNDATESTLACYCYYPCGDGSVRHAYFQFNLNNIESSGYSPSQLRQTVIHEFAHYVRGYRYGESKTHHIDEGHDEKWREICIELGCRPDRYHNDHRTRLFKGAGR